MLRLGITGGIGSGKTTVCKIFETLDIPIYYADDRAKWLMVKSPSLQTGIIQLFGDKAYAADGSLNRAHIGGIAFKDPAKLQKLNALVHPAVFVDGENWQQEQLALGVPYTLKEAALIYETGSYKMLDKVIVVTAPEEIRIQRVMKRDKLTAEEVKERIARQMPESEKVEKADYVIQNDGQHSLIKQVLQIHQAILELKA
ncbi:MAG: dephospho-CoA kinase [Saprospiraceae bacterium]|nr:dephospho-CoA kinase [Saprospiraceae bacterium]